jgi:hypothetical protein
VENESRASPTLFADATAAMPKDNMNAIDFFFMTSVKLYHIMQPNETQIIIVFFLSNLRIFLTIKALAKTSIKLLGRPRRDRPAMFCKNRFKAGDCIS